MAASDETMTLDGAAQSGSGFKLRSYQTEMVDRSLKENIIVAMDTGSGKTHIAIARIRAEVERLRDNRQLVWFLAPSRTLAEQQYRALDLELSAYGVRLLTGADGVEKWTDQRLWDAVLTNIKVVIATPAVLKDALAHGFVTISRLALCVFDEAHRCTKKAPMNQIMQLFYRPARERGEPVPHILGLSASPVTSVKQGGLETIESNLHSLAVTPKTHRTELEKHVNLPELLTIRFSESHTASNRLCDALAVAARSYDLARDPYFVALTGQHDDRSRKILQQVQLKQETYCLQQLRALDTRAARLHKQLGPSMAQWYISTCIRRFRQGMSSENFLMPDLSEAERKHLLEIFEDVEQHAGPAVALGTVDDTLVISEKARLLLQILLQHAEPGVHCLIFVEQRVQVTALAELLRRVPALEDSYKIAGFVGTSTNTNRKISVADLVALSDQSKDLQAFRDGHKNVMVATNVLEEGIDISACNLVICFDAPKNLVSFVQRRGRARRTDSKYFLFVSDNDSAKGNKPWSALEAEMKAMYMDDSRKLQLRPSEEPPRVYGVASTGAMMTMDDAMSHLYHFCSVSTKHANNYIDLRPEFETNLNEITTRWSASVDLPMSVHPSVRHANSAKPWETEEEAIKDAALEAYIALHRAGLVNDNLLPLIKDYGPQIGVEHIDQPSIVEVADRISPLSEINSHGDEEKTWSSTTIQLLLGSEVVVEISMWLPAIIPIIESFHLYWNSHITYQAKVSTCQDQHLSQPAEALLHQCTSTLLRAAHAQRMETGRDGFAVLFGAADLEDASRSIARNGQAKRAADFLGINGSLDNAGLARIVSQQGRSYFIEDISQDSSELTLSTFPRRKDFLHPIPEENALSSAHTGKQTIKIDECTIDVLPAKYALFSAFVPSILYRLETSLLVRDLMETALKDIALTDHALIKEAISSPAAGEPTDYNRLEYLGDCVLKHYTELQVMSQHTDWPEAYLTLERDRIVRNSNLAKAALERELDKYILTKPFTGSKWRPPYATDHVKDQAAKRQMSTKTLADVVEALIGAAYLEGDTEKAFQCIRVLLPQEKWSNDYFETLIAELTACPVANVSLLETLIGHTFSHPTLLVEATTHGSSPANKTGMSYERLEFLGDSVLDMIITPKLFSHPRKLKHWQLHSVHAALVNSHLLGYCCLRYYINQEMFDIVQTTSGNYDSVSARRKTHLYEFMRAGAQVNNIKCQAVEHFHECSSQIEKALAHGTEYPWVELVTLSPPKFFCDLVESILGAIFIDTHGNLAACEVFVEKLGILNFMHRILDEDVNCVSPKEMLGIVADQAEVKYINSPVEDDEGRKRWQCVVKVDDERVVTLEGCRSKDEAEVKAAYEACGILKGRGPARRDRKKRKMLAADVGDHEYAENATAGDDDVTA